MASKPGRPKYGGRKKGTPNKKTEHLIETFKALNLDVPERIVELLPKLSPEKQAEVLLELMSYLYPKRKAIEVSEPGGEPVGTRANEALQAIKDAAVKTFNERKQGARGDG